ncbi:MAG TPA: nucleotidyltransferase domain-containing protein [Candidatus Binataceae bacterium]|nr:nucleotidyltransferase domain-containing protein [Candidatus Binataceae bacterium]
MASERPDRTGVAFAQPQISPRWVVEICRQVADRLGSISRIRGIALGGSRARGTARDDSDIDLALYYDPDAPFAIEQLEAAARELDDRHSSGLITPIGAWGPGVNGGGWLFVDAHPVDLLYRDLRRVRTVIEQCLRGEIDAMYQLGHPLGFQNQIYIGEAHFCCPVYDPAGELAELKQMAKVYPERMRRALADKHLFDAQFEIEIAAGPASRGDTVYTSQCLARATGFMVLVLYALNRRFFLNEKNAFVESRSFHLRPPNFHREVEQVLGSLGNSRNELERSVAAMRAVAKTLLDFCTLHYAADQPNEQNAATRNQFGARLGKPF